MYNWLKQSIKVRNISNVKLTGRIDQADMGYIYNSSSALLLSLNKSEILSLTVPAKLQTYMHSSKPIICSADGEVAKIINDANCGIVCESENPEKLASSIFTMYKMDNNKLTQLGLNGKKYFDGNFEIKNLSLELIKIFKKINE